MNKLSKDKRDKLILVCLGLFGVLGCLYTFVLGAQKQKLGVLNTQIRSARDKVVKAERLMSNGPTIETSLAQTRSLLEAKQEQMAPQGQYYYWFLKSLDQFRKKENLDTNFILDLTQPEFIEAGLLPKFPYRAASFGVRLNGRFRDIGRFLADLENNYPYFRLQSVRLIPAVLSGMPQKAIGPDGEEKLVVETRIITLIKPGGAT